MDREELRQFIRSEYDIIPDNPWLDKPNFEVFRHSNNKKWFALIMDIPGDKLGLNTKGLIDIVNLKCNPILNASLQPERGIFPAYHMSKSKWITACLDGSTDDDIIKMLLEMSYNSTKLPEKKRGKK